MTLQIDKDTKTYVVTCDTCPEHFDTECDNFDEAKAAAKKAGWRTYLGPGDLWANSCPPCVDDFAKSKRR
jgi:hypothetical protein